MLDPLQEIGHAGTPETIDDRHAQETGHAGTFRSGHATRRSAHARSLKRVHVRQTETPAPENLTTLTGLHQASSVVGEDGLDVGVCDLVGTSG